MTVSELPSIDEELSGYYQHDCLEELPSARALMEMLDGRTQGYEMGD